MSEAIWYDDIGAFITQDNYYVILPSASMSFNEKINALLRLFLYLGVLLTLIKSDLKYMFFGIIAAVVSVIVVEFDKQQKQRLERFLHNKNLAVSDNVVCTKSTVENPFMNPSIADIAYNPTRPPACNTTNPDVQQQIDENFNARLFRDVGDLYGKMASQREYYTVPSTTIPNNQTEFAEWLYGTGSTCKENNGLQCATNININYPHLRAGASTPRSLS